VGAALCRDHFAFSPLSWPNSCGRKFKCNRAADTGRNAGDDNRTFCSIRHSQTVDRRNEGREHDANRAHGGPRRQHSARDVGNLEIDPVTAPLTRNRRPRPARRGCSPKHLRAAAPRYSPACRRRWRCRIADSANRRQCGPSPSGRSGKSARLTVMFRAWRLTALKPAPEQFRNRPIRNVPEPPGCRGNAAVAGFAAANEPAARAATPIRQSRSRPPPGKPTAD
jgi:hypothetical protein